MEKLILLPPPKKLNSDKPSLLIKPWGALGWLVAGAIASLTCRDTTIWYYRATDAHLAHERRNQHPHQAASRLLRILRGGMSQLTLADMAKCPLDAEANANIQLLHGSLDHSPHHTDVDLAIRTIGPVFCLSIEQIITHDHEHEEICLQFYVLGCSLHDQPAFVSLCRKAHTIPPPSWLSSFLCRLKPDRLRVVTCTLAEATRC